MLYLQNESNIEIFDLKFDYLLCRPYRIMVKIVVGMRVIIGVLQSRPDLQGTYGEVQSKGKTAGRWVVLAKHTGEVLSIKDSNISPTTPSTMPFYTPIAGTGSTHPRQVDLDMSIARIFRGQKAIKQQLFTPFTKKKSAGQSLLASLEHSPFGSLDEDLLLSVLIRAPRETHRALAATCKRFRLVVRGKRFVQARRKCPTTGFSCKEQQLVLVGGGGWNAETNTSIQANAISSFSHGGAWSQGTFSLIN